MSERGYLRIPLVVGRRGVDAQFHDGTPSGAAHAVYSVTLGAQRVILQMGYVAATASIVDCWHCAATRLLREYPVTTFKQPSLTDVELRAASYATAHHKTEIYFYKLARQTASINIFVD